MSEGSTSSIITPIIVDYFTPDVAILTDHAFHDPVN
jgi:hypothetical protein